MSNDKIRKMAEYFQPQYDSDEDLDDETRKKIQDSADPNKVRNAAWDKADMYPKLKRMVKSGWYGDKRKPQDE